VEELGKQYKKLGETGLKFKKWKNGKRVQEAVKWGETKQEVAREYSSTRSWMRSAGR
jgi:hypothetical protein